MTSPVGGAARAGRRRTPMAGCYLIGLLGVCVGGANGQSSTRNSAAACHMLDEPGKVSDLATRGLPRVLFATELGEIELEIDTVRAPVTGTNFLRYVDDGAFTDGSFFRTVRADNQPADSVRIAVVQGGAARAARQLPPIPLEPTSRTGLRHGDGTISMARASPHSATSSFFITIGDQPQLDFGGHRNPDGLGFAAFGRVLRGMDVVRAIHAQAADAEQRLLTPVRILTARRIGS